MASSETGEGTSDDNSSAASDGTKVETLIVVSKVKNYIREQSGFNTSGECAEALSKKVAEECLNAINRAKEAGRKTVMGRDFA